MHTYAQIDPCSPGCSKIANGDFEQPNIDSLSSQGLDSYGGVQYPSGGDPFNLGHVSCWESFELSPHIWPTDTSSSLNHFSVYGSVFLLDNSNLIELSEKSAYTQEFCLDSGLQYKLRYNYFAYLPEGNVIPYWQGWWTYNFTDNINYNIYAPGGNDDVISTYIIGNDSYNPNILSPPSYLSINFHYVESDPFIYRNQQYLILGPKINTAVPDGAYGVGIFIDNIEFIPFLTFENAALCDSASKFIIYSEDLSSEIDLEFSAVSPNITNCLNIGDSCIITVSGMSQYSPSEITLAYTISDTACNGDACVMLDTLSMSLNQYLPMSSSIIQLQEVSCIPNCDGIVQVSTNYGSLPFQYLWNNSTTTAINSSACVGINSVNIIDSNGCEIIDSILVTDTINFELLNVEFLKCVCESGSAFTVPNNSLINGTSPFTYFWSTSPIQTNDTIFNIGPGIYSVTIVDASGCVDSLEFNASCLELQYRDVFSATCPGVCNGWIQSVGAASINPCLDPVSPISFQWSNGQTIYDGDNLTSLCPGEYWVTMTDASGMVGYDTLTIGYNYNPILSTSINNVSCIGACDGYVEATLNNTNAFPTITFILFNSSSNQTVYSQNPVGDLTGICNGSYSLIGIDNNGCADTTDVNVNTELFYNVDTLSSNDCALNDTICIDLTTIGSFPPYSYEWSSGQTTQDVCLNAPGTYYVTTTDTLGCEIVDTFNLTSNILQVYVLASPPTCDNTSNGEIEIIVAGGLSPYNYEWSTGDTIQMISALGVGTYAVTITDSYGCSEVESVTFTDYLYLTSSLEVTPPTCVDSNNTNTLGSINLTPDDGVLPYSFVWSNSAQTEDIDNLTPGTYTVTITDSLGCEIINTAVVPDSTLIIDLNDIGQGCDGDPADPNLEVNGTINSSITGGTAPYTYAWNVGGSSANLSGLTDYSNYVVTVTDNNGCIGIDSIVVMSQQTIFLNNGWGFFSTYIQSSTTGISDFFNQNGLSSEINIMLYSDGSEYNPSTGSSALSQFANGVGYQINMTPTTPSFKIEGSLICPEDFLMEVDGSQNPSYIGYLRKTASPITTELSSIANNITIVRNGLGAVYWPQWNFNQIGNMNPGEGYSMTTSNNVSWHYTPNSTNTGTKTSDFVQPLPDNSDIITDQSMVLGIPNNSWINCPEIGDIIQARGEHNQIVGRSFYFGGFVGMSLFGDDSCTPGMKEGLSDGESFTLEVISQVNKSTTKANINLKNWEYGDEFYKRDKINLLGKKNQDYNNLDQVSNEIIISPNPNNGIFTIEFTALSELPALISIRNINGQIVFAKREFRCLDGKNIIQLNIPNLAQGTYILAVITANKIQTNLLIITN